MPPSDLLIAFFFASAVFACVPGSSMLYASARTLASGRKVGWWSAVGFHMAGLVHIAAAASGASVLLAVMPALFMVMKLLGAAYLIGLGVQYLRGARLPVAAAYKSRKTTPRSALRDSFVVEVMNPKSALFFLAFLPQFTSSSAALPVWAQVAILGMAVNVMFSLTDAILIEISHAVATRLRSAKRFSAAAQRIGGGVLIALGLNLALAGSN